MNSYVWLKGILVEIGMPFRTKKTNTFTLVFKINSNNMEFMCIAIGEIAKRIYITNINSIMVVEGTFEKTQKTNTTYIFAKKVDVYTVQKKISVSNVNADILEKGILGGKIKL